MQKHNISFELSEVESIAALAPDERNLMQKAIAAREGAYAPYSNFHVGAAVLMENGAIVIGSNQENASYPSGLCAERVAIFHAGALYPGETITAIAITASAKAYTVDRPAAPCGNCRQSISEYETKQKAPIRILFMGAVGPVFIAEAMADLLPLAFNSTFLK
ncbi:cytidine deaminase [Maribacter sp. 2-571]|uniref:cytidine deaminase n=1 Tax=Maribacter sp. 2-571 TaxID=3417569 RepID=UPI003D32A35D